VTLLAGTFVTLVAGKGAFSALYYCTVLALYDIEWVCCIDVDFTQV